jgi:2-methylcitrate dehydratase
MGYDPVLEEIADYIVGSVPLSEAAYRTARWALADSLSCAFEALAHPEPVSLLGPVVAGTQVPDGTPVPGTSHVLDPVSAAFSIGVLIRWLDYNDTWLAREWGHPSDNFGAILAAADHMSRQRRRLGEAPYRIRDVLAAAIQAYEVQGILALGNSLNQAGFDHVLFVKVASAGVTVRLLGGGRDEVLSALSNAFADAGPLRVYRHHPNTGPRKSWAAADATSRGVWLARLALLGQAGYPQVLSASPWGFEAVILGGKPLVLARPLGSYVMENVLFKVAFPAEFHGQTAVEAALKLHPQVRDRLAEVERVLVETQEPARRIIDKPGPFRNPADRDHSLQYMVAAALVYGELTYDHYLEPIAQDPRIDALIGRMEVVEAPEFTEAYFDPERRAIPNALTIRFKDGSSTGRVVVEYPLGHPRRRPEALPLLREKSRKALRKVFPEGRAERLERLLWEDEAFPDLAVDRFMDLLRR